MCQEVAALPARARLAVRVLVCRLSQISLAHRNVVEGGEQHYEREIKSHRCGKLVCASASSESHHWMPGHAHPYPFITFSRCTSGDFQVAISPSTTFYALFLCTLFRVHLTFASCEFVKQEEELDKEKD